RFAGPAIPHDCRFALVRDADCRDVARANAGAGEHLDGDAGLRRPDLERVVLHPAWLGKDLSELALRHSLDSALSIEQDGARARGPLIQGKDVRHVTLQIPVCTARREERPMRESLREMLAEFLGTFVLIVFGTAVVAQVVLSRQANGSYLSINLGWGLAVVMAVYVAGGVTGAHLNPAVTLTLAVRRGFPWGKVLPYWAAQLAGAFAGALVTFVTYREAFHAFDGGVRQVVGPQATAGIFATYPQAFLSTVPGGVGGPILG